MHQARLGEFLRALDVHRAPDAPGLPWCEADRVPLGVDRPADAVDPAEAQGLINRLRPGDAGLSRALLVEAHQELAARGVMLLEPRAELGRSGEERRLHRSATLG